jgi:hypothetical protein
MPDPPDPPPRLVLVLRDLGDDLPAEVRLRSALKALLRRWRFRCDWMRDERPSDVPEGARESEDT